MTAIHLHGELAKFGGPFFLDVRDAAEAIRAVDSQVPGLREVMAGGSWHVIVGPLDRGVDLGEESLSTVLDPSGEIHILPAVGGAGNGVGQVIAGIALIAVAWWNPLGWTAGMTMAVGGMGVGITTGGIVQMATKVPSSDYGSREAADKRPSFLFDGPTNTSTQGLPVPVIYGRVLVGSVVISAGISSEEV